MTATESAIPVPLSWSCPGRFEWEPRDTQGEHAGFTVGGDEPINFVYDFSVVRRGPPGNHDYLVQPEIGQTGPGQAFVAAKDQDENGKGERGKAEGG